MRFDFHGVGLSLEGPAEVLDPLERDFAWFRAEDEGSDVSISVTLGKGPALPPARAKMTRPDCVVYDVGGTRWVDYHGEALVKVGGDRDEAWGEDPERLAEIVYLLALSKVGERHDRMGIHRVHALAFTLHGRTCMVLLPEGGGKSTLALALLAHTDAKLLSEDTPLVDREGRVLPFPLRIAVRDGQPLPFPESQVRTFTRKRHGVKRVVDVEAFRDRIGEAAPLTDLLVGVRATEEAKVEPISGFEAFRALGSSLVFGLGLPQVVEFFLRGDLGDVTGKAGITLSRIRRAASLSCRARTARLVLGLDAEANVRALEGWIS